MARLRTPHVVALAVAGALLLGVRPAGGEVLPPPPPPSARSAPGGAPAMPQLLHFPSPTQHHLDGPQPYRSVHRADAGAVQLVRLGVDGGAHGAAAAEPAPRRHAQRHGRLRPGELGLRVGQWWRESKHTFFVAQVDALAALGSLPSPVLIRPLPALPLPPAPSPHSWRTWWPSSWSSPPSTRQCASSLSSSWRSAPPGAPTAVGGGALCHRCCVCWREGVSALCLHSRLQSGFCRSAELGQRRTAPFDSCQPRRNRPCRSYPRLESALDWLLSVYKFVFPFLVRAPSQQR